MSALLGTCHITLNLYNAPSDFKWKLKPQDGISHYSTFTGQKDNH